VVTKSGNSYEKEMLLSSIRTNGGFDPMTRAKVAGEPIVPNVTLTLAVEDFVNSHTYFENGDLTTPRNLKF